MNDYFYSIAERAACVAADNGLPNIDPRWVYSQWAHETAGFASELMQSNYNLGGLCQLEANDTPQPDGAQYYIQFPSFERYADYFGRYLTGYVDGGIDQASTLAEYVTALKISPSGAYFGDTLENYLAGCEAVYEEEFG